MSFDVATYSEERKKKRREDNSIDNNSNAFDVAAYSERRKINKVVTNDWLNDYQRSVADYYKGSSERYNNSGYTSFNTDYENNSSDYAKIQQKNEILRNYLKYNKGYISEESYNALNDYLKQVEESGNELTNAYNRKRDFFGQFKDENEYNAYERNESFKQKYADKTYQDMMAEYETADEFEKNYIDNNKYSKMTDDELEAEKKTLTEDNKNGTWEKVAYALNLLKSGQEGGNDDKLSRSEENVKKHSKITNQIENIDTELNRRKKEEAFKLEDKRIGDSTLFSLLDFVNTNVGISGADASINNIGRSTLKENGYTDEEIDRLADLKKLRDNVDLSEDIVSETKNIENEFVKSFVAGSMNLAGGVLSTPLSIIGADENTPLFALQKAGQAADESIMQNHDWNVSVFGNDIDLFDQAYQVGMGVRDNLMRMAVAGGDSAIAGALMGAEVLPSAYTEAKEKGYSTTKAIGMAGVQAAIEALTEKYSVETILGDSKGFFSHLGKSFLAEGSEEVASNISNRLADILVNTSENEIMQKYNDLRYQGKNEAEALTQIFTDMLGEDFDSFVIGGLSGAALGAGADIANKVKSDVSNNAIKNYEINKYKNELRQESVKPELLELAKQTASPETYEAYEQARNSLTEKPNFKLTNELKKSSKALAKEIRNNISAETTEVMNNAIKDSLQENKISENQIESVIKYASNQNLNEADVKNIQSIDAEVLDNALKSGANAADLDYSQKIVKATKSSNSKKAIDIGSYSTDGVGEADGIYYNGNKADIISFINTKNGEVKLSNGDTVNVSDLEMSSKQATVIEGLRQIAEKYSIGNDDATILYEMATGTLDSDTDTYNLMYAVDDAIRLGSLGVKSAEKVLSSSAFITAVSQNAIAKNVIDKAYNIAYKASETVKLHDSQISNAIKGKGKLNYDKSITEKGLKNYSREQRAHIAVAESLSKVFSNKITVYDSENVSGDMQWAKTKNGSFRSQDGTIWIDINAQQGVLGALSHELTHMVSLLDESTFKKISEILIDEYADITKTKSVEDYIREYEERLNLGTKAAYEEFVADCMTNMLTDTNAAEAIIKLRNTMNEKAQNRFIKLINDTIRTLKSFVKRSNAIEAASITSQLKSLQKISDLWAQGVSNAMTEFEKTENKEKTVENDFKNSLKGNFTADEMEKNIKTVANMKSVADLTGKEFVKGDTDLVTQVYKYFNSIGNKVESKYGTVILNRTGVKSSIAHGIGRNKAIAFKAVPNVIKSGAVIDYTDNYKNRNYATAVFAAPISINRQPFYMAVVVNVNKNSNEYYLHEVALEAKKEDETSFKTGNSQKATPSDVSSSLYSLLNKLQNVNENFAKNSEKLTNAVDSDGNKLSEAQAEFFKDSKVRDKDGNLLKVYHGTSESFTVFDKTKGRANMDIQGMFFSPWEIDAKGYGGNVNAYYLNIKNPASGREGYMALNKFKGQNNAGIKAREYLESLGYDGVNNDDEEYVAFNSNQIKLTDNLTPTENEDIRYSDKLDTDYLKLANEPEKNEKELNKFVESAAMEWGAYSTDGKKPVKLYHGTDKFGFTKFDISKSDDRRTIFLTNSPEIASTYSQISGERKISERTNIDVDKLSMAKTVELLNKYPEYSDFEYEYSYTNGKETEEKLNTELTKLNSLVDKLMEKYKGEKQYVSTNTEDYYDRLLRIKKMIFDKEQRNKYLSTQLYINLNNTDMFSGNEDFINEVEQDVRLANILEAKDNPNANYVVEKSMGGYSIELLSLDEAKDKLRESQKHGNYALYAKFDNPLVIDADGKNWNDIYAILEPSEKTTFKAEYDLKDNALVLSDEKGAFATLTVNDTLESVLPSMARAITNRYGKFFAATVFAQAKDKLKNSSVAEVPVRVTGKRNTREIAEFAQEHGYDGVIFKDLKDNGGRNAMVDYKTAADVYVVFTPNTIKSADTVTYGDDGEIIPLSERFSADEDIRYSEKNSLNSEEKGIKQQMIDASAELDKMKPVVSFNEMPTFNSKQDVIEWALKKFEKFGDYITREGYGDIVFDRKRITKGLSYLKTYEERVALATVPYVLEKGEPIFSKGNHKSRGYSTITFSAPVIINGNRANVGVVVREEGNNYYKTHRVILPDGSQLVFENDIKKGSNTETKGVDRNPHLSSTDITSNNSLSQISENVNNKFSEKIGKAEYENVIKSLEKDNVALREDINDLKELVKVQGKVTHGEVFTKTSVEAVAKKLARDFGMKGGKTELVKMLNEYYSSIASSASDSNLNFADVMENALPIARYINENIPEVNVLDDQAQEILDYLKTSKISLNELQKQEVASAYDSYNNYRKSLFGNTVLSDGGTPLDIVWKDLSERFPSVFDEDTNPNDMPIVLKDAIEAQKSNFSDNNEWYAEERVQEISQAVYDGYWRASTLHSVADKYQTQINRLKSKHMDKMTTLRENRDKRIANIKAKNTQSRKNAIEKRNVTVERHKAKAKWDYMYGLLTSPTKERNIGTKYQKFVRDMLLSIEPDISADGERGNRTRARLQEQIQTLKGMSFDSRSDFTDEVVQDIFEKIKEPLMQKGFKGLNSTELNEVNKALRATRAVITNEKKLFLEGREATVSGTAKAVTEEVKHISKQKNERITKIAGIDIRGVKRFALDLLKPEYAFRYVGSNEFNKLFKEAQKGDNTMARDIEEADKFCADIEKKYNAHKWKFDKQVATVGELPLKLGELMSLYAYSRREAADLHLSDGGIATPDSLEKKVKGVKVETERIQTDRVRLDKSTVQKLTDKLTKDQKAFVDEMQKYLSETMAAKGNEVSQALYEIDLFTEKNYFPLKVDSEFLAKDMKNEITKASLKSSGMTKATIKNANKPIVLENFIKVWSGHVAEMSMYHSYVLGIENLVKVFNYTDYLENTEHSESVRSVISAAYGKEMTAYLDKFLVDLNGGVNNNYSSFSGKAFSKFKKTAVAASLSVAIQQPMAIVRAMSYINPQYFVKIPKHLLKTTWTELKKHSGIAVLKEIGGFDIGNGRGPANYLKNNFDKSFGEKFDDGIMYLAGKGDEIGWSIIWNAAKAETAKKYPQLKGEALLKKAGERFDEVVSLTQVYDSTFSRSGIMRSNSDFNKMATSFMGEPITSLNMYIDAAVQSNRGKISKMQAARIIGSVILAQVLGAAAKSLIYAGRDDADDKSYGEKYFEQFGGAIADEINPLNLIPIVRDIWSLLSGNDVERPDMTQISNFLNAIDKLNSDDRSTYRKIEDFAGAVAAIFGIPVKNVMRDMRAIYNTCIIAPFDENEFDFDDAAELFVEGFFDPWNNIASTYLDRKDLQIGAQDTGSTAVAYIDRGKIEKGKEVINELINEKVESGKTEKQAKSAVRSSFTSEYKERYIEAYNDKDNEEMLDIRRKLQSTGLYDDVSRTCQEWIKSSKSAKGGK